MSLIFLTQILNHPVSQLVLERQEIPDTVQVESDLFYTQKTEHSLTYCP